MLQLLSGQTFEINDHLISDFPWFDFLNIEQFTISCSDGRLPQVEMLIPAVSQPGVIALFKLYDITECKLPVVGHRKLQFSDMRLVNIQSRQVEMAIYNIFDENFVEPSIIFNHGEIIIH